MNDNEMGQVGCFMDFIFIIVALVIAYLAFNTSGDKMDFIVLMLVVHFIHKVIKNSISKI